MTSETVPWILSRVDGAYYGKISFCAPMYKGGGYNRPDLSHIPASAKTGGYIRPDLSHIPASAKTGGYNRPGLVSHTRVRESRWVYST